MSDQPHIAATRELFLKAHPAPAKTIFATMRLRVDHESQQIALCDEDDSGDESVPALVPQIVPGSAPTMISPPTDLPVNKALPNAPEPEPARPAVQLPSPSYKLRVKFAEGGMGEIWRAEQTALGRSIAVKMIKAKQRERDSAEQRFLSEAIITASLSHPNIMPIHDLALSEDGRLMLAMEEIGGVPWSMLLHPLLERDAARREVLRERAERMPLKRHLSILLSVCDAVAYAHSRGYIHRDLKPEQVMVGDFGEVILLDWGLAIPIEEARRGVRTIAGTPAYLAPEQTQVPGAKLDERTDVYLLGGMLYEILTLQPPHPAEDVYKCLFKAAMGEIRAPQEVRPDAFIPQELANLAMRALALEPGDRPKSVAEFRLRLHEFLNYRVGELMEKDAFWEVRRGVQPAQERDIVVKTIADFEGRFSIQDLSPGARDSQSKKNMALLTEARILRLLQHPNMPVLYDVDIDGDGRPALLMRPISGKNLGALLRPHPIYGEWTIRKILNEYIKDQPPEIADKYRRIFDDWLNGTFLTLAEALEVLLRAADVLLYAHTFGIVHRHLRPPSIYVDTFGRMTLTDWGFAVDIREEPRPQPIVAPPRYLAKGKLAPYSAPEILNEKFQEISERTDVYGMSGLLFQSLCGLPPHWPADHNAESLEGLQEFGKRGMITPPARFAPEGWTVPPALDELAMKGLSMDPKERPSLKKWRAIVAAEMRRLG